MNETVEDGELRKEVFDYLRQLQQRAEQSAKLSGMSSWVLVAAMCYLAAWLLEHATTDGSQNNILIGLAAGLCVFYLRMLIAPSKPHIATLGTRLSQFTGDDTSMVGIHFCLIGLSPVIPVLASYVLFGWTLPVIWAGFFGVVMTFAFILGPLVKSVVKKSYFRSVYQTNTWANFFFSSLTILALSLHAIQIFNYASAITSPNLVFAAHVTALWWIILQLTRTADTTATMERYAHLEEALMFGVVTPAEILKKLELQAFGPSLEKELKSLEEEIQIAHQKYVTELASFRQVIVEADEIPSQYLHEKAVRIQNAFQPFSIAQKTLATAIETKTHYIGSLLRTKSPRLDTTVRELLARETRQLKARVATLKEEGRSLEHDVKASSAHLAIQIS